VVCRVVVVHGFAKAFFAAANFSCPAKTKIRGRLR